MPIYEYACAACGKRHEVLQKMSEEPLSVCPDCGAAELRKLVSKAGFRLKGTGWYETDFKDSKRHNVVRDESSDAGGAGSGDKGEKKAESSGETTRGESAKPEGSAAKEKGTEPAKGSSSGASGSSSGGSSAGGGGDTAAA